MNKIIRTLAVCAFAAVCLMAARSAAARAPAQPPGVFVNSIKPGVITAIAGDHLTIKNADGETYDIVVRPGARVQGQDGHPLKLADVQVGEGLGAAGWLDGKTLQAASLVITDSKSIQSLLGTLKTNAASAGKTHVFGQVTQVDGDKLTVERPDHVTQVVAVDAGTAFEASGRDGASGATLADVKAGSMITAMGSLQGDTFVATKVYLIPTH